MFMVKKVSLIVIAAAIVAGVIIATTIPFSTQQTPKSGQASATDQNSTSNTTASAEPGSVLKLSSASVPIDIPLMKGYENGSEIYFIGTDVSDKDLAAQLTNITKFKVNYAPLLAKTPQDARGQIYIFENGIAGNGSLGFQVPVASAKPGDEGYSPLQQVNFVKWTDQSQAKELKSVNEIMEHKNMGHIAITQTDIVGNHPAIKWQGGQLPIREDKNVTDDSKYGPGQVLNIDTQKMVVTMVAHRGWGPDGKSIYYIVTDTTPEMPSTMMGVSFVPINEKLAGTPVAVDLFQFMNGINGTGPMGFQAGIGGANPGEANYSPMWKINFIAWKDPSQARLLETMQDINAQTSNGSVSLEPAMGGKHVVNCPFFDQQTVFEHKSK